MQDYEEPTPPESSWEDYPEPPQEPEPPTEPDEIQDEPNPVESASAAEEIDGLDQQRQEGTPDKDKTLAELISDQLRHIDGTTGLTHGEIAKLANQLAELTKPAPTGQGDPLQPIMEQVLDMLTKLGERMTTLDRRMTALESRQYRGEFWATQHSWFMTGLIDELGVKPAPPPTYDYNKARIDFSAIEPPLPPSAD